LQFSLQPASPETFGYIEIRPLKGRPFLLQLSLNGRPSIRFPVEFYFRVSFGKLSFGGRADTILYIHGNYLLKITFCVLMTFFNFLRMSCLCMCVLYMYYVYVCHIYICYKLLILLLMYVNVCLP